MDNNNSLLGKQVHIRNGEAVNKSRRMNHLFRPVSTLADQDIDPSIRAEVKMVMMIVHHNTFFNLSEHISPLVREEFHGHAAADGFHCGRTKTAAIVNCIGTSLRDSLVEELKSWPFSLMVDGSNDHGLYKMFPITVRVFDINWNRVMTKFLDLNLITGRDSGKAAAMFESIDAKFQSYELSWDSVTCIGMDNTNVNMGIRNSIKTRVVEKNENIVVAGCPCHILHNAAGHAASRFNEETGFDVEDHSVDLYYWFDKSSKRKSALAEYYQFCDQSYAEVVRHVSVRWLSLEQCVNRELKKYISLKSYFQSEEFNSTYYLLKYTYYFISMFFHYLQILINSCKEKSP